VIKTASVRCELCKITCTDQDDFIVHCSKDRVHHELQVKFTDETFDFLFQEHVTEIEETPKQQIVQFQSTLAPKKTTRV